MQICRMTLLPSPSLLSALSPSYYILRLAFLLSVALTSSTGPPASSLPPLKAKVSKLLASALVGRQAGLQGNQIYSDLERERKEET